MNFQAQKVAWLLSGAFAISFFMARIPNPLVGTDGIFLTNLMHDLVHLLTAIGFVIVARMGAKASVLFMKSFGAVYLGVAILGFIMLGDAQEGRLLGVIHINAADNFLHLGFAATIIALGFITNRELKTA
ncbi:MAG: DUF4383 domain-containing protein [Ectothiorhodospiraceae bacterium]|nr:DUF4383 domain-containing protein [Ectothiorhodospiraceae bacterium]